jgi:hypothetical protein
MRRWSWLVAVLLLALAGVAIGVSAYHAGQTHGLEQAGKAVEVVRVYRPGFFPFGLLFFPLFFFGIIALLRAATWRRRWAMHGPEGREHWAGPGSWKGHGSDRFEEWHRRQHEASRGEAGPTGPPGGTATV